MLKILTAYESAAVRSGWVSFESLKPEFEAILIYSSGVVEDVWTGRLE